MQLDREQQLHDYLDDRLSAAEREEFEAAMRRDPALAAKVASFRRVGETLRSGDDELGEAFYARARERFESTKRPMSKRLWSWEGASLLAAAVLACALFLPTLFNEGLPTDPTTSSMLMDESGEIAAAPPLQKVKDSTVELEEALAGEDDIGTAVADLAADADRATPQAKPPVPRPAVPPSAPKREASADAAESEEMAAAAPSQERVSEKQQTRAESFKSAPSTGAADRRRDVTYPVVSLALAPPSSLSVVTLEEWRRMASDPRFDALSELGSPSAEHRLLWVGQGLDCDRLRPAREVGGWRVELHAGDAIACALLIPADGLPVLGVTEPPR